MVERRHPPARREDDREELERLRVLELLNEKAQEERKKSNESYAPIFWDYVLKGVVTLLGVPVLLYLIFHKIFHSQ